MRPQNRFIVGRNTAGEDEVQLMLLLSWVVFLPEDFSHMQQGADFYLRTNLLKTFTFQGLSQGFTRLLLAAGKGIVKTFGWMLLLLNKQLLIRQNERSRSGSDSRPERRGSWR